MFIPFASRLTGRREIRLGVTGLALAACLAPATRGAVTADLVYRGACDASAAVALDADHFVAASDENNRLRIYRRGAAAQPQQSLDLSALIRADPKHPESDLEGAARLGDMVFWISSHSLSRSGKERAGRDRFFATRFPRTGDAWQIELVGASRDDLGSFLTTAPGLADLRLAEAAMRSPKTKDALNIEGLCATPEGHLLIGFRNPIRDGKALLVPLRNPHPFVTGAAPDFGPSLKLDLGGLGIREMIPWRAGYLIAAGAAFGGGDHQLWYWAGGTAGPRRLKPTKLKGFDVEAMVAYPGMADSVELLSDDSGEDLDGKPCPKMPAAQRQFRSLTVRLPEALFRSLAVPETAE